VAAVSDDDHRDDHPSAKEARTMQTIDETLRVTTLLAEDSLNPARARHARWHGAGAWLALLKGCACVGGAVMLLFFTYRFFSH
jgi:hypothetical protein